MKWKLIVIVAVIFNLSGFTTSSNVFTIVGPKFLRKGEPYKCTVTTHDSKSNVAFNLTLSGFTGENSNFMQLSQIVNVPQDSSKNVEFSTGNFPPGSYRLTAIGQEKITFVGEKDLVYITKTSSIFIQTDKPIYKADDTIRFRVFAINPSTAPYSVAGDSIVTIKDPAGSKVKQYSNVTFVKGKYESELLLSSAPQTGSWSIVAEVDGEITTKTVEVQEYTLPAFSAIVSAPKSVALADGHVPITVGAQYTFGQKVEGSAVVTFKQYGYQIIHERSIAINSSSVTFDVDIKNDLMIEVLYFDQSFLVEIQFTDKQTGQLATAATEFTLAQSRHNIVIKGMDNFKPGLNYVFSVFVKNLDGSPAPEDSEILVQISFNGVPFHNETFQLDHVGAVELEESVPLNATYLEITAFFRDAKSTIYVSGVSSYQKEFLSIDVLTPEPLLFFDVEIDFRTTENVPLIHVLMVSRSVLVRTEKIKMRDRRGSLTFNARFEFAPSTSIVAYYVNKNNEVISDSRTITLKDRLPNYLNLAISPTTCKPGENVQVTIGTTIQSTVSLLALDQRMLLLKSGNDLSLNEIYGDLEKYNQNFGLVFENEPFMPVRRRPFFPFIWYDTYEMKFERANFLIISNAVDNLPSQNDYLDKLIPEAVPGNRLPVDLPVNSPVQQDEPRVRKDFSESFLWETVEIEKLERPKMNKNRGREVVNVKVPDSITSFVISGVAMNERFGLALPSSYPKLTIFQPFFIQFTLPFSVKRGEKLKLDIFVFNFLSNSQSATVSVQRNDAEFSVVNPSESGWITEKLRYFQTINSNPETSEKVTINIIAKALGFVTIKVTAVGNLAGDAIEQKLRVVPEGIPRYLTNSTVIVKDNNSSSVSAEITCAIPPSAVSDTISVSASVAGDIMGSSLKNIENLIRMSYGCGEQNMLNFVPNIVILRYLEATNKLTPAIRSTTVGYMEKGYQRQLEYLRSDGSFSAFGNSDPFGSTWLTAFVVKSFLLARRYITIDMDVVQRSLDFLISKQNADGSFREDGRVIHSDMQGGSSSGKALTAYVAIVLTEVLSNYSQYETQRNDALQNIITNYNETDVYSLGIISYALSLVNHPSYSMIYFKFYSFAIETASELHWEKIQEANPDLFYYQASSLDVEITAYALLSLYNKDISKSLKIIRWVVKQQTSVGGFKSTQDTVIALEALAAFSAQFTLATSNLVLDITPDVGSSFSTFVNSSNSLVLQTFNLSPNVRRLNIQTSEIGTGLVVSLSCNYYELIEDQKPRFKIDHHFVDPCIGYLKSSICLSFIPNDNETISNMVLVTVKLPSGFIYEERKILNNAINKVETTKGGTEVNVYISSLSEKNLCFYINAIQVIYVEELKSGSIQVIDYYDTSKKASAVINVPKLSECQPKPSQRPADYIYDELAVQ